MLIRFNVKNFLSFSANAEGRSEEFSMIAGKVRSKKEHVYDNGKIKLLKLAAVYGANASGKSNLVKALDFMKQTVIRGFRVDIAINTANPMSPTEIFQAILKLN